MASENIHGNELPCGCVDHSHQAGASHCSCEDSYALLAEVLDQQCSEEKRLLLEHQLEACPECFRILGIEKEVRHLLRSCCHESAPTALRPRIVTSIHVSWTISE